MFYSGPPVDRFAFYLDSVKVGEPFYWRATVFLALFDQNSHIWAFNGVLSKVRFPGNVYTDSNSYLDKVESKTAI